LAAHPELLIPRRAYEPDRELDLFDEQRVYDFLAQFTFERTVDGKARVSLGRQSYLLGKGLVQEREVKTVLARLDPEAKMRVFLNPDKKVPVRRPPKGLDRHTLTGLDPSGPPPAQVVQLTLPFFEPKQGVRLLLDS